MPRATKATNSKTAKAKTATPKAKSAVAKPKAGKAKPKPVAAKPKAATSKIEAKPAVIVKKPSPISQTKAPDSEPKVRKPRSPNKPKISGSYERFIELQSQLDKSKEKARKELRAEYEAAFKVAENKKAQYEKIFGESLDHAPKAQVNDKAPAPKKVAKAKKPAGVVPFTQKEIESFIALKSEGLPVKISGRRSQSVEKLEAAYKKTQDPEGMLEILNT